MSVRPSIVSSLFCMLLAIPSTGALTTAERAKFYSATPDSWALADSLDPLPGWPYKPMVEALLAHLRRDYTVKDLSVRLLAWSTQEDTRPLLVDSALLWATFTSTHGQRWVLSYRYRHPRVLPDWRDATPTDVDWSSTIVLDRPPKNADVYALLTPDRFPESFFGAFGSDYTVHTSGVRAKTWLAVVGEPPTEFFK